MHKARLYWHIFVTEKTPAIVTEQLRFVKRQPFPVTAVVTRTEQYTLMDTVILELLDQCKKIDTITVDFTREFEFDTHKILYREAHEYDYVGYFHTKGAVMESSNTHMWRNLMNYHTVQGAEASIGCLENNVYDFVGVFGSPGLEGQHPFIAGNFWWAKTGYIRQLPFPELKSYHTRYDCELWIGIGCGRMGTYLNLDILGKPLTGIAAKYKTDKKDHGYLPFYELYLAKFRALTGNLLEIGVYEGESLKLWQEALPYFTVEGVDIEEKPEFSEIVHVGDQADRDFLSGLPGYDIVIDDGGHRSRQQIISLVSKIKPTSLYVIEDLHTSQPELYPGYHDEGEVTCLDYLTEYPSIVPDYISADEHKRLAGRQIFIEQGTVSPIAFII